MTKNPLQLFTGLYGKRHGRKEKIVLNNINFTLHEGDSIGILGINGAGKTTLLRVLAGVYKPSQGSVVQNGTVYGLFDVQAGMKQDASGIENIYLRGLQMGMKFAQIKSLLGDVIDFAEIGSAIYDPISSYSNGMRMRLALAISTMINPDILLLDEWIGAGDQEFRKKINDRMMSILANSKAMVIATHSQPLMKKLCNKGLIIDNGKIKFFGEIENAINIRNRDIQNNIKAKNE